MKKKFLIIICTYFAATILVWVITNCLLLGKFSAYRNSPLNMLQDTLTFIIPLTIITCLTIGVRVIVPYSKLKDAAAILYLLINILMLSFLLGTANC